MILAIFICIGVVPPKSNISNAGRFPMNELRRDSMLERRSSDIDRRTGNDRRGAFNPYYFYDGGVERRSLRERRSKTERRKDWLRVDEWCSVLVYDLKWDI